MSIAGLRRREGLGKAKLPCKKRGVQLLGCGRSVGTKPFPHSPWLYCLVQAPFRKENGWSGKKPPPRHAGLAFSSPVALSFPEWFGLGRILLRLAGTLAALPLLVSPPLYLSI